ncbi:DUF4306 domain-containing protein [Peribacillus deserti]|uniref:DUF4306 domain-containing protein n=1 Tax=Peribacillus deserti TaxID=673318 RepID=A0A2N5M3B9_9BACI|nr:DUF4306 domain-containing protein [Peribacillus deserti]PLT28858.1 hypothetical protein CUU66_16035 [Peribacillus deserti]
MFRYSIQAGLACGVLLFCGLVSWYEGSALLDDPYDWKYTLFFTPLFQGGMEHVEGISEISQLDYFVYAAKYKPLFPMIMLFVAFYLAILTGYKFLGKAKTAFSIFLLVLGVISSSLSIFILDSPTHGGELLSFVFICSGIGFLVAAGVYYFNLLERFYRKLT